MGCSHTHTECFVCVIFRGSHRRREAHGFLLLFVWCRGVPRHGGGRARPSAARPRSPPTSPLDPPARTFPAKSTRARDAGSTETRMSTGSRARNKRAQRGAPLPPRDGRWRERRESLSPTGRGGRADRPSAPQRASPANFGLNLGGRRQPR